MLRTHRNESLHRTRMIAALAPIKIPIAAAIVVSTKDSQLLQYGHGSLQEVDGVKQNTSRRPHFWGWRTGIDLFFTFIKGSI